MSKESFSLSLHEAASLGKMDVVQKWLDEGVEVDFMDDIARTPLMEAAISGHLEVAKCLIVRGADVNARDEECWTPLAYAIYNNNFEFAQFMIEQGADAHQMKFWTSANPEVDEEYPLEVIIKNTAGLETWLDWCAFRISNATPVAISTRSGPRL